MKFKDYITDARKNLPKVKNKKWEPPKGEAPPWLDEYNPITPNYNKTGFRISYYPDSEDNAGNKRGFEIDYGFSRGQHWGVHSVDELIAEIKPWVEREIGDYEKKIAEMNKIMNIMNFKGPGGKKLKQLKDYLGF